jgi:hypothetical protein
MPTIAEVREKFPQYRDLSDQQLADALHNKFYADMPKEEFEQKVGLKSEPQTKRGYGETFARAAAQGLSFNLADEFAGARNAASTKIPEAVGPIPLRTLAGIARTGFNAITGLDPGAAKDYEQGRDEFRTAVKEGAQQNPITSTAGNVTGALAGAAMIPGAAATLPLRARMAVGALQGAGYGAASGAGEGENWEDRATGALKGGAVGGVIGGVAPAVVDAVGAAVQPLAGKIAATVRGLRDPEAEAARRLAATITKDIEVDPQAAQRLTPREFAQSAESGGPATLMDIGGEGTRALARSAANQSPEGRAILNQSINDRFEGQSGRVTDWLRRTFHYPDAETQSEALLKTSREVNKPAYGKAYREGSNMPWDETFEQIAQAPEVQGAIRKAMVNAKSEAAKMGFTPPRNPFYFDEATGRLKLRTDGETTMTPNLQFWDIVKRNLDKGDRSSQDWAKILRDRLDEIVPSYQEARRGAAHFFDADNALEAGEKFVGKSMSSGEARRALAKMTDQERQLFQDGFVSKYVETLNQVGDRRSILNQIAASPAAREKLHVALGRERADQLEASLRVEGIMDHARKAVQGNSSTARQLAELGLAGSAGYGLSGGGINPADSPGAVVNGLLAAGARYGGHRIEGNVARRLADLLVSKDPRDLQRGIDIIRRSPRLMNVLRGADKYISRVAGEEAS